MSLTIYSVKSVRVFLVRICPNAGKYGAEKFRIRTSQTGQKVIIMHNLPNISRSKDNQKLKFGQLIKYNLTDIFFKSCKKQGRKVSSTPFFL